jgi:hypothetical protein
LEVFGQVELAVFQVDHLREGGRTGLEMGQQFVERPSICTFLAAGYYHQ